MRVLVTGAGGPAGRSLLHQLAGRGIPAIGVDVAPVSEVEAERMYRVPAAFDAALVPVLLDIADQENVTLLVPTVSEELPHLAAAAQQFGPSVTVCVGEPEPVALAHDKLLTALWLQSAGVPVPPFATHRVYRSAASAFIDLGGPLVVKPRISRGGRGVRLYEQAGQLDWGQLRADELVQLFMPGTEYAVAVYNAPRGTAGVPLAVVLEKTELAAGRVGNGVAVRRLAGDAAEDVAAVAVAACAALDLRGPVDVDIRRDAAGAPRVLEVNARFGAHSACVPELLDRVLATAGATTPAIDARPSSEYPK